MPSKDNSQLITVITGAAGMIGSQILRALAEEGHRIVACDFFPQEQNWHYFEPAHLDAIETWVAPEDILDWIDAHSDRVGAIIHMGAISDTTETRLDLLKANNVTFTLELWQRASTHDWAFLYASSAATYGAGEHGFVDRDDDDYLDQLRPLNPYGQSKLDADKLMVADWRQGKQVPSVWAGFKFFNVYGPNEDHKGAMRSLVRKIVPEIEAGKTVRLFKSYREGFADGEQLRDFIYVKDAIQPVRRALHSTQLAGLFNVGTGQARSFVDLALATYSAMGVDPDIAFIEMPISIKDQYQYYTQADTKKAVDFGLQDVRFSLERGIADYVAHLTEQARVQDE